MRKPLLEDRSWRAKELGGVERLMERSAEVSRSYLGKKPDLRTLRYREPWLRAGEEEGNQSNEKEVVAGDATGG
jgi:hypothetical protein